MLTDVVLTDLGTVVMKLEGVVELILGKSEKLWRVTVKRDC